MSVLFWLVIFGVGSIAIYWLIDWKDQQDKE